MRRVFGPLPDETTILNFRHLLETQGLGMGLFLAPDEEGKPVVLRDEGAYRGGRRIGSGAQLGDDGRQRGGRDTPEEKESKSKGENDELEARHLRQVCNFRWPDLCSFRWPLTLNDQGQLGIGTQITRTVPIAVTGGLLFSGVSAGGGYSCGVTQATGVGYCWGEDISGSLGAGGAVPTANPTPTLVLGGHTFTSITAGGEHTCGVVGGLTYCWGLNASGELGIGSMVNQSVPFLLPMQHGINLLLPGLGDHTCGLNGLGEIYCWGLNSSGQVGVAAGAPETAPVMVPGWPR